MIERRRGRDAHPAGSDDPDRQSCHVARPNPRRRYPPATPYGPGARGQGVGTRKSMRGLCRATRRGVERSTRVAHELPKVAVTLWEVARRGAAGQRRERQHTEVRQARMQLCRRAGFPTGVELLLDHERRGVAAHRSERDRRRFRHAPRGAHPTERRVVVARELGARRRLHGVARRTRVDLVAAHPREEAAPREVLQHQREVLASAIEPFSAAFGCSMPAATSGMFLNVEVNAAARPSAIRAPSRNTGGADSHVQGAGDEVGRDDDLRAGRLAGDVGAERPGEVWVRGVTAAIGVAHFT